MKKRKKPQRAEAGAKARRQARLFVGKPPPARIIEPKPRKPPRHRKKQDPEDVDTV